MAERQPTPRLGQRVIAAGARRGHTHGRPAQLQGPAGTAHHRFGVDVRVAEAADHGPEHGWIADAAVDADAPFLHLADDHVDGVGRRAEAGIELADVEAARRFLAARHGRERQTGGRKAEGQDVDVGDGAEAVASRRSQA